MRLIALKTARYGTRALRAGDPFDAQPEYGRIWKLLGMAADAPKAPAVGADAKAEEPKKRGRKPKAAEVADAADAEGHDEEGADAVVTSMAVEVASDDPTKIEVVTEETATSKD